jgi:hypothetical protein
MHSATLHFLQKIQLQKLANDSYELISNDNSHATSQELSILDHRLIVIDVEEGGKWQTEDIEE